MNSIWNIRYWLGMAFLWAFCILAIYIGFEVLIFVYTIFANPPAVSTTPIDASSVFWGLIITLLAIAYGVTVIIFFSCQLAELVWMTMIYIIDEISKKHNWHYPASWIVEDIIRRGDFSKCWNLPMQLH